MQRPRVAIPTPTSFEADYNARSWPMYAAAIQECGGEPVRIPLDAQPAEIARLASGCQAIVLPGSPADVNPEKYGAARAAETAAPDASRERADELLLQDAYNMRKPILGICYGLQSLNVWCGGSLVQDLRTGINHSPGRGLTHSASFAADSLLAKCLLATGSECENGQPGKTRINSSHHQSVEVPGDGLTVTGRCPDDGVIEALEGQRAAHFVLGVQWHPEKDYTENALSMGIFRALVERARLWHERM